MESLNLNCSRFEPEDRLYTAAGHPERVVYCPGLWRRQPHYMVSERSKTGFELDAEVAYVHACAAFAQRSVGPQCPAVQS